MTITMNATGNIIKGDLMDVNPKHMERLLKDYDPQLYLKWQPKRRQGRGVWQIRRKPENYSVIAEQEEGKDVYRWLDYRELDIIHGVLDCPDLDYRVITKLKEIDTWQQSYKGQSWGDNLEYNEYKAREKGLKEAEEHRRRVIKDNLTMISDLRSAIASGVNPNLIGKYWK